MARTGKSLRPLGYRPQNGVRDAGPMLDVCFRRQHPFLFPEEYEGKVVDIEADFPRESMVGAELLPEGMNGEGYVWPELVGLTQ